VRKFSPENEEGSNFSTGTSFSMKVKLLEGEKDEEEERKVTKVYYDQIPPLVSANVSKVVKRSMRFLLSCSISF